MGRIRTIKPEFFRHEGLQDLERTNPRNYPMLVFAGLFTVSDKSGRFEWKPRILQLDILPFLDFDMAESLDLLETAGFLRSYSVNGKKYGLIPTFSDHQRITGKEFSAPNRYPDPDQGNNRETPRCFTDAQEKEKEKEKENKKHTAASPPVCELGKKCNGNHKECTAAFDKFWAVYPRHDPSRKETKKAWCKQIHAGLKSVEVLAWIEKANGIWIEKQFIPMPTTFLNKRRWEGDLPPVPSGNGKSAGSRTTRDTVGECQEPGELDPERLAALRKIYATDDPQERANALREYNQKYESK